MLDTLFYIPERIAGVPTFGAGWLLAVWAVASVVLLAWLVRRQGFSGDTWSQAALLLVIGFFIWRILPAISEPGRGLPIHGYGVMLLAGIVAGVGLTVWRGRRLGIDPDMILALALWGFVPGIIGGRLFYVIEYWQEFQRPTLEGTLVEIINLTKGGLVVYGAFLAGMLGFLAFLRREKLPVAAMLDLAVPGMLLGLTLGRIGCFMHGCCFGGVCDLPWAVQFPADSPPYARQLERGQLFVHGLKILGRPKDPPVIAEVEPGSAADERGLRAGQTVRSINGRGVASVEDAQWALMHAGDASAEIDVAVDGDSPPARWSIAGEILRSRPTQPTQIYSAIDALILCLFLLAYDPLRRRDGELLALLLTIYPVSRFLIEILRTDEPGMFGTVLSIGQIVSVLLLLVAAGLWIFLLRKPPGKALPMAAS